MDDPVRTRQVPYQRVAVIGLGAIGMAHVQATLNAPSTELVAVVDIDPARVEEVAATHDCRGFTSIEAMVDLMDVDIAIVCTPDQLHVDAVRLVAQAGVNILLEKPIATTVEDALEILRIVEEAGVAFTVGHCLRFDPKYVEVKRAVEAGALGDLATVYARRQNQTGVVERLKGRVSSLLFLAVHDIDIVNWYMRSKPVAVYCASRRGTLEARGYDVDDVSFTTIRYEDGSVAVVESGWLLPPTYPRSGHFELVATGSAGVARLDEFDEGLWIANESFKFIPLVDRLTPQLEHFAQAVMTGAEPLISGAAAFSAMEVALAAEISAREGREVPLPLGPELDPPASSHTRKVGESAGAR